MNTVEYNLMLTSALKVAINAHKNQTDKSGEPYILHPLRVAFNVPGIDRKIVAILHNVIEDTDVTLGDLCTLGISTKIIDSIVAITRGKKETHEEYIKRVKLDDWARDVKIADINDNMDPVRLAKLDEKTFQRLTKKYTKALDYLNEPY